MRAADRFADAKPQISHTHTPASIESTSGRSLRSNAFLETQTWHFTSYLLHTNLFLSKSLAFELIAYIRAIQSEILVNKQPLSFIKAAILLHTSNTKYNVDCIVKYNSI